VGIPSICYRPTVASTRDTAKQGWTDSPLHRTPHCHQTTLHCLPMRASAMPSGARCDAGSQVQDRRLGSSEIDFHALTGYNPTDRDTCVPCCAPGDRYEATSRLLRDADGVAHALDELILAQFTGIEGHQICPAHTDVDLCVGPMVLSQDHDFDLGEAGTLVLRFL
jgi:hypothetical protein